MSKYNIIFPKTPYMLSLPSLKVYSHSQQCSSSTTLDLLAGFFGEVLVTSRELMTSLQDVMDLLRVESEGVELVPL